MQFGWLTMPNWLLALLAREWSGLAVGALVALGGWLLEGWIGIGLCGLGALLAVGNLWHLVHLTHVRRRCPPPGRMIDLGGYKVHMLAEGVAGPHHPVVMFGGGHAPGLAMGHLHASLKNLTRSILIDRPGTGWSDTGPFPRTTAREAEEMVIALEHSGESGPFLLVGYSFGGLLAANIARRHPEKVARLLLLDPTPLETIVFGPRLGAIRTMLRSAWGSALLRLIGIHANFEAIATKRNASHGQAASAFERQLGEALQTIQTVDASAGAQFANYSIYHELLGPHVGTCGWETVVYDGDLGDMDVWLVAPPSAAEVMDSSEVGTAAAQEQARMINFFARSRERYLATTSRPTRIYAPEGSTHQFVYEEVSFVRDVLERAIKPLV
ncbi:MAG: alpha/beta fold hydrolase [Novosphingobium sp.]|jgi:pimeloyl-ACP methyl ester carboxylesterase|uniref:alpha/beta fold hydrolase n=1 Tax=Novosphingobium sp. TaxID=1874826 RepID=UPI00391C77E6